MVSSSRVFCGSRHAVGAGRGLPRTVGIPRKVAPTPRRQSKSACRAQKDEAEPTWEGLEAEVQRYMKEHGLSREDAEAEASWDASATDPCAKNTASFSFEDIYSVKDSVPEELRTELMKDGYGPPAILAAGFQIEEYAMIRYMLDSVNAQHIKLLICGNQLLFATQREAIHSEEMDWAQPRPKELLDGGGWGAQRAFLFSGLSVAQQGAIIELLQGEGMHQIAVCTATPETDDAIVGDLLGRAVTEVLDMPRKKRELMPDGRPVPDWAADADPEHVCDGPLPELTEAVREEAAERIKEVTEKVESAQRAADVASNLGEDIDPEQYPELVKEMREDRRRATAVDDPDAPARSEPPASRSSSSAPPTSDPAASAPQPGGDWGHKDAWTDYITRDSLAAEEDKELERFFYGLVEKENMAELMEEAKRIRAADQAAAEAAREREVQAEAGATKTVEPASGAADAAGAGPSGADAAGPEADELGGQVYATESAATGGVATGGVLGAGDSDDEDDMSGRAQQAQHGAATPESAVASMRSEERGSKASSADVATSATNGSSGHAQPTEVADPISSDGCGGRSAEAGDLQSARGPVPGDQAAADREAADPPATGAAAQAAASPESSGQGVSMPPEHPRGNADGGGPGAQQHVRNASVASAPSDSPAGPQAPKTTSPGPTVASASASPTQEAPQHQPAGTQASPNSLAAVATAATATAPAPAAAPASHFDPAATTSLDDLIDGRPPFTGQYGEAWLEEPGSRSGDDRKRESKRGQEAQQPHSSARDSQGQVKDRQGQDKDSQGQAQDAEAAPSTGESTMDAISRALKSGVDKEMLKRYIDQVAHDVADHAGSWIKAAPPQGNTCRENMTPHAPESVLRGSKGAPLQHGPEAPWSSWDMREEVRQEHAASARQAAAQQAAARQAQKRTGAAPKPPGKPGPVQPSQAPFGGQEKMSGAADALRRRRSRAGPAGARQPQRGRMPTFPPPHPASSKPWEKPDAKDTPWAAATMDGQWQGSSSARTEVPPKADTRGAEQAAGGDGTDSKAEGKGGKDGKDKCGPAPDRSNLAETIMDRDVRFATDTPYETKSRIDLRNSESTELADDIAKGLRKEETVYAGETGAPLKSMYEPDFVGSGQSADPSADGAEDDRARYSGIDGLQLQGFEGEDLTVQSRREAQEKARARQDGISHVAVGASGAEGGPQRKGVASLEQLQDVAKRHNLRLEDLLKDAKARGIEIPE